MYVIEVFSIRTRTWTPCYTSDDRNDAALRFWRLYNDGYTPRLRINT